MSKFEKAVDFYLRGFNSEFIKRRTGISMQSLLKQLLAKGIKYTKDDIVKYQIEYIKNKYSIDEIETSYKMLIVEHKNPDKERRGRYLVYLGCGFGDYPRVYKALLGCERYQQLKNDCWHKKQSETVYRKYGVNNVFQKEVFSQLTSEDAIANGRIKRTQTMIEKYGVEHPNQNAKIVAKMQKSLHQTNMERYGVNNVMQRKDIAVAANKKRQEVMLARYGVKNSVEIPEVRNKIFEAREHNKTLNTSKPEEQLGIMLRKYFGENDVLTNVIIDSRYPYHVDYYIKSLDLFIELNGDKCHNSHWFDASSERDLQILNSWQKNADRLEQETGKKSRYRKYIETWTQTDVAKRQAARNANLNYLVFWDGSCRMCNKKQIPNLSDAYAWFEANCPMPHDWRIENTY